MKNFNNMFRGDKSDNDSERSDFRRKSFSPNRSGSRDRGGRGGDRGRMEMFEAICSDCGKKCQVPFRPTGDKPVYCSECFNNHGGAERSSRPERSGGRSFDRPRFQDKRMFDATCDKCGKRFELPFRPTGEKPVYCSECFERGGNPTTKRDDKPANQYKEQFEMLNSKLDRIIKALNIATAPVKEVEKKEAVVVAKPVEEKVAVVVAAKKEKKVAAKPKAVVAKPAAKKVVAKLKATTKVVAKKKKTTKK